ncbi:MULTISPECIES: fibronectin-binding protein EfbA [Enterococcus]|uniref:Rqc2 homolog RqcH n=1 Tax=Enterococcus faecium EnGen0026 TaxID=1138917 RepID=A0A829ABM5_ENTFC|nr:MULTISPECIES: fibronectin-binding protein EfbA [Enterococcus]EGP4699817.1 fibronectin/fibrinogen-binding protein [Enterococcus faecium]EGP4704542.1 fibronectin/fibrinogen-binding protein [Enterococcus faecium]EGP4833359.1 fibronectin/fibrinogen-binding protein [Enterococcus faecium]EGP4977003.1 fibronectin/fibrinogen-binding protein [Enterococcus faecium]EGP5004979.1 fibronectin/fibrinogen-binding protein [Enterococcus faecium]
MSFDGVFTHAMVNELRETLLSGRISKIHQPYENEIVLVIRSRGKNHRLLFSAHPSYARVQITQIDYQNPDNPPNFVMMLRKYLDGAILENIEQIENDRVIHFHFAKRNELGDLQNIILIVELMGRHSTIVLVNQETGKILDAIKHIGSSQNTYRSLLPGVEYIAPPKQEVLNPFSSDKEKIFQRLSQTELEPKAIQHQFQGIGFDTAQELTKRLLERPNEKMVVWHEFFSSIINHPVPTFYETTNKDFFTPIVYQVFSEQASAVTTYPTLSQLLDSYYHEKAEKDRAKQQGGELIRKIKNELKRNKNKLKKREQTLKESENAENYRRDGELLTTFLTQVPRGAKEVVLPNYYEEDRPIKIALDPALTPNQNAQKYFHRYQKLKNAVKLIGEQIQEAKDEIQYLESVLSQLEIAGPMDIEAIKEELTAEGYLKKKTQKKQKNKKPSQPDQYFSSDGTLILVGKNNLQNDQLTMKTAKKTDYWLHAKNIPGSHVIIKSDQPSDETITEAAELAAYFSKYRYSAQVPVDLVQVKHIRKPNGAKPGYVIYENQKTVIVTPEEEKITAMKQNG